MKRSLLLLLALCLVMVAPAMALTETFQDWSYSLSNPKSGWSVVTTLENSATTGVNAIKLYAGTGGFVGTAYNDIGNPSASAMTYSAATLTENFGYNGGGSMFLDIDLYDSTGGLLYHYRSSGYVQGLSNGRYEVKMVGGQAQIFINGVYATQSGVLAVNPSYVYYGVHTANACTGYLVFDDLIWGETDHHVIGAIPTNWSIHHDFINPASDGVYAWNPNTNAWVLKNSNFFYIDADKEFGSVADPEPENLQIAKMSTGTIVNTTSVSYTHNQPAFSVSQFLATSGVTSGQYSVGFEGSTVKDYFWLIEDGGFISFNKSTYNLGETGTLSWYLTESYIDLSTYTYTYEIVDVFGNVKASGITATTETDTSGQVQITFSDTTYDQGAYYAEMIATNKLTAEEHILGATAFTLTDHVEFQGYVNNAENETAIDGANISVTQAGYISNTLSGFNGNYTSNATFVTGYPMTFNVTKTGYRQYTNTFTPLVGGTHALNLTLIPSAPTCVGVCIGGFVKDNVYGNPIFGATVNVQNGTLSQNITNIAGYYRVDNLVANTLYDVWSTKTGFGNSTVAQKLAVGA